MKIKSIILAAGKGSRMRSDLPKVMHKIGGKSMLHHVIDTCKEAKSDDIVIVVGHHAEVVIESVTDNNVSWVYQNDQLGTGHAVIQAIPNIDDNDVVLIAYGDVPLVRSETLKPLCECIGDYDYALLTTKLEKPTGYGRIVRDSSSGEIIEIVEEKDASDEIRKIDEVNTGIVAAKGKQLKRWLSMLTADNAQKEYYLTDCVAHAVSEGAAITSVLCMDPVEIQGVNNRQQQAELERGYQARQAEGLMVAGATLLDPQRVDVRGEVTVGKDVIIDINAVFIGNVHLSDGVSIEANCVIKNSSIGANTTIKPNSVIDDAEIGALCDIGPFARIRPDTVLKDSAKVGNFVEIKKSTVGEGSKVSHLSYIGDTEMGANVNIGAGTITCNYDGVNKFKTVIGDDAFVGSDSQLIAPVTIKAGATIGAGSTITQDTPEHTLTLSRSKQVSITGWKRPTKLTNKDS
ncbi:bifunctional UDP-N-acetylglucosamine diphosphorylase/glucosamine-1-phosphate N-acetyltransferase GlmU [Leucothrix arctica]|uniref:Bifunctional protein GlmU n=1 Tax=Leucothrix arctica TaxID=1481894 RepID=A0A317CE01_9GAMM|nr:bifunctional UDP-N-acetylglucosamine diphosphorylase/glucosamine-1-phosphate N-acetyltransferase GlmU [Leucothrix arctica]PWQ94530.1 UDP-N-acetylglucosamine diphosphorylase/glucosamine-1-phosphate N-acetyltransferase [Leucothrix arctica]